MISLFCLYYLKKYDIMYGREVCMSKDLYIKNMIKCLKDKLVLSQTDSSYYKMALALAYLSLQGANIKFDETDKAIFPGRTKRNIEIIIRYIALGLFEIKDNNIVITIGDKREVIDFSTFYRFIENHMETKVNHYTSSPLCFKKIGYKPGEVFTESALPETIFYQVKVDGKDIPISEVEKEIDQCMNVESLFLDVSSYEERYNKSIKALKEKIANKYPGCSVKVITSPPNHICKGKKRLIGKLKSSYDNYDTFYSDLLAKMKPSLTKMIKRCYFNLDSEIDDSLLIRIFGLAIFLLNKNLKDFGVLSDLTVLDSIYGFSTAAFDRFAKERRNALSNNLSHMDFTKSLLRVNIANGSLHQFEAKLYLNSVLAPCSKQFQSRRNSCFIDIFRILDDYYSGKSFNETNKNIILALLDGLAAIERQYLYYSCDEREKLKLILSGLSLNGDVRIHSDESDDKKILFTSVDEKMNPNGVAVCSLDSFISLLSSGLTPDEYGQTYVYTGD